MIMITKRVLLRLRRMLNWRMVLLLGELTPEDETTVLRMMTTSFGTTDVVDLATFKPASIAHLSPEGPNLFVKHLDKASASLMLTLDEHTERYARILCCARERLSEEWMGKFYVEDLSLRR